MSRIGKKPITITQGVTITPKTGSLEVVGPKGKLEVKLNNGISVDIKDNILTVSFKAGLANGNALLGLNRSLIQNAVTGVTVGWTKTLELVGVGYRAQTNGKELNMSLGFSHPVIFNAPESVTFKVVESTILVEGPDKYTVGELAAQIRKVKKPEPYKGKGIRYKDEKIRKKAGKAKALGGAPGAK